MIEYHHMSHYQNIHVEVALKSCITGCYMVTTDIHIYLGKTAFFTNSYTLVLPLSNKGYKDDFAENVIIVMACSYIEKHSGD